jgi:hypothetical protein
VAQQPVLLQAQQNLQIPILQGLLASGKIPPPTDHPEWSSGHIDPKATDDIQKEWLLAQALPNGSLYGQLFDSARQGFSFGAPNFPVS